MTTLIDHRRELIAQLESELSGNADQLEFESTVGWPAPYWEIDRRNPRPWVMARQYLDGLMLRLAGYPVAPRWAPPGGPRMADRNRQPEPVQSLAVDHGTDTAEAATELRHDYGLDDCDIAAELGIAEADVSVLIAAHEDRVMLR